MLGTGTLTRIVHTRSTGQSFSLVFPPSFCTTREHLTNCVRRFSISVSRRFPLSCHLKLHCKSSPFSSSQHHRTMSSSLPRTLNSLNDAFSDPNKARIVKQLGLMKPRKSWLASCTEEAAVFVPLCLVDSVPSVLFTLRSSQLNSHRGEVSFPGGKKDPEDSSLIETAIREMDEELGLDRRHVEVWAPMPTMPDRLGKTAITPILGFIGEIDVTSLQLNPHEVASVFTLTLDHVCSTNNQRYTKHKHLGVTIMKRPVFINGPHRIWGLTAIILDFVMEVLCPDFYRRIFQIKGHGLG